MSFMSKFKKTVAALAAGGVLLLGGGNAIAEPNSNDMWAFREAYLSVPQNNRVFHQSIVFFGTTFHVDFDSYGQILRDASMRMSGNMNWEYTSPSTNVTTNNTMPFYVEQTEDEMIFYVQRNKRWSKFPLPGLPAGIATALTTSDVATLQNNLKAVKDVEIFRENNVQQIFNVTLDGKYLADILREQERNKDTTGLSAEEITSQKNFFENLEEALQNIDVVCTWTYNKVRNETTSAVIDLTQLMRAYAQNVLDDSAAGKIVLSDEERLLMDTIGYYSEFHFSISYGSNDDLAKNLTTPSAARKAQLNNNIFQDFIYDMTTSVKK